MPTRCPGVSAARVAPAAAAAAAASRPAQHHPPHPPPVRKQGLLTLESHPGTQTKDCKGLSKRCLAAELRPTHVRSRGEGAGAGAPASHRSTHRQLRCARVPPPQIPSSNCHWLYRPKPNLQSNGGRVSFNDSRGLRFPCKNSTRKGSLRFLSP